MPLFKRHLGILTLSAITVAAFPVATVGCASETSRTAIGQKSEGLSASQKRIYEIGRHWAEDNWDEQTGTVRMPGSSRHLVRESANYAYGLLLSGTVADLAQAEKIIASILDTQDLREDQDNLGAFPWSFEDDWETLARERRDPNYTAFVGSTLGLIIALDREQGGRLDRLLCERIERAFRLALDATLRRDVAAGYTNIVLLSAAFAAQGDTLFGIPEARAFAERKLTAVLDGLGPNSTFDEYLSPTYYGINLQGLYTALKFASPSIQPLVSRILDIVWKDIAKAWHAPTFQLAGPHSRTYGENLFDYAALVKYFIYLAADPTYPLPGTQKNLGWDQAHLMVIANLPVGPRTDLRGKPDAWREIRAGDATDPRKPLIRQYRQGDFILGSVSHENIWDQQRNVVAYWPLGPKTRSGVPLAWFVDHSGATEHYHHPRFASVQSKSAVLASLSERGHASPGGQRLVFSEGAKATPSREGDTDIWRVRLGDVVVHVYPVTRKDGKFTTTVSSGKTLLERSWANADQVRRARTLAYLIVFQLPGEKAPEISGVDLQATDSGWLAVANVNGERLELAISIPSQ